MTAPVLGATPTFITSWFCPYAQRVLIALNAKKATLPFELHEVSHEQLYVEKPQWLLDLNPAGKVPMLAWQAQQHESSRSSNTSSLEGTYTATAASQQAAVTVIRESLVINEYLEEAFPQQPLLPQHPVGRAAARFLVRHIEYGFIPAFKQVIEKFKHPDAEQAAAAANLNEEITLMLQHFNPQGPFAMSDKLSLVDCAVAPHFLRLYILRHYADYRYKGPESSRLTSYVKALQQHPAVAASCYHPEGLDFDEELLRKYAHYGVSMAYKNLKPLW